MQFFQELQRRFTRWAPSGSIQRVIAIALGLISIAYLPLYSGKTVFFADNFSLMVPGKIFTAQWLSQGILPLWNPLLFGGLPWIGDINQSILYPSTLLFVLFSPGLAVNLTVLLQLLISFVGVVFLAKKMGFASWQAYVAAVLWTFSPQVTGSVNNIATLQSITWLPWVVLAGLGIQNWRGAVLFSLVIWMQLSGGYPQHVLYSILTAVVVSVWHGQIGFSKHSLKQWRAWFLSWLRAGVLSILFTSVLWMPFLPVLAESTRSIQTPEQAASGSLQLAEVLKLIVPTVFESPRMGMKWGVSWTNQPNLFLYFSWLGLLIAAVAIIQKRIAHRDWWLLGLIIVSLIVAFGDTLPTFALVQAIPILSSARGASIILMIPALVGALLVARWLGEVQLVPRTVTVLQKSALGLFIASLIGVSITTVAFTSVWESADSVLSGRISQSAFHTLERDRIIAEVLTTSIFVLSLSLLLTLYFWQRRKFGLVVLIIALEMAFVTQGHIFYADMRMYEQNTQFTQQFREHADTSQYRVLTRNYNSPYSDFGAYWDALSVREPFSDSYIDAQEMNSYEHLQRMRDGLTPSWQLVAGIPTLNGYTTLVPKDMHVQFAHEQDEASINRLPQIMIDDPLLQHWSVGYYLVDTWFPDYDEPMPETTLLDQEPWRVYELPDALPRFRTKDGEKVELLSISETPNQIRAKISIPDDSGLIVADRFDSNWRAQINGTDREIQEYQGLRLMAAEAGEHKLQMWYQPTWFYVGAAVTGLSILLSLAYTRFNFKKP